MSKTFVQKLFIGIWNQLTWNKVIMYMYCSCTYNSSWYHFVPITCMSVKGFSISYNVVNFFFKSRYFYMCIFSSKTIGWLPFLWRLSRFVSQFVFCLSVKYLKSVPIAGQCQKLFGPWLIWPKINRVLYFYLSIKFIVNLAQDFFYIDIHQTTPCLTPWSYRRCGHWICRRPFWSAFY